MSSVALSTSLLSQMAGSSGTENVFATDLNQLTQDLQSGNLSAAQQDWVTLSTGALQGTTASTATTSASGISANVLSNVAGSASATSTFVSELNQVGIDLQNGDLSSAQGDMLAVDATAMGASASSGTSVATPSTIAKTTDNEILIAAIVKAMGAGDTSLVSTGLSQLAASSSSSEGASVLASMSGGSVASSASSSATSQVNQLLQSLTTNSANSSLSLLA
jgi:hypothetical protein